MADKQLTAKLRLNTKQFESQLNHITKKINKLNNSLNGKTNRNLEKQLRRTSLEQEKLKQAINKTRLAEEKVTTQKQKTALQAQKVKNETDKAANSARKLASSYHSGNAALSKTYNKLRAIAGTYLGIMGMRGILNTSDIITSAQNKLNYTTATSMGSGGYNADGTYSTEVLNNTQKSMDKMYASAQKVRMAYTDMMSNVSKSMALAGDSFDNSTDRAIRFQEIMAEAYAIGGASAAEMSSSMYQLMQALGSGTLAGDELRSVREGAPLAYKAIEKFAQEVYNTTESLKELGSQGKVTSDMVVEAIMNAGKQMDNAFAQTNQTFAQTWTQIKNAAIQAFRPVSEELREMLQSAVDNGMLKKFENFFAGVAKAVLILMEVIKGAVEWIADNWSWLQDLLIYGLGLYIGYLITMTGIAITNAAIRFALWLTEFWYIALIIATIGTLIYIFYMWKTASIDTIEAICLALLTLGIVAIIVGAVLNAVWLAWVSFALIALTLILYYLEYVMGGIYALGAVFYNVFAWMCNMGIAFGNVIGAIFDNIGIWWSNICASMGEAFWNFVADTLSNFKGLGDAINAVYKLMGGTGTISINSIITGSRQIASNYANSKQEYKDYGAAWNSGENTYGYKNIGDAYNKGFNWGNGIKDAINNWGSKFQNGKDSTSMLDKLGDKLGLNFAESVGKFPSVNDPSNNLADAINPAKADDLLKDVSGINDNTGSVADALKLTNEDLSYLRKLAETEWKKEYTTAEIKVEMNNSNTVNGETDLDGIVTKLSEKLYEEMSVLANGVYA